MPTAIPLFIALQRHAQKENERTLIATELAQPSPAIGNGTSAHSHKKRQPPLPKPQAPAKGKTRTSARQANGRSSTANASTSTSTSAATSPRPKRVAAQRGRGSWAEADADVPEYEDEEFNYPQPPQDEPMDVDDNALWSTPVRQGFGSAGAGRGGIMKGFGPGAYGKVGGLALGGTAARSSSGPPGASSWGFPPEPPR